MTWAIVAELIVKVGIPATQKIIAKWENGEAVTSTEFADVRATAQQSAVDRVKQQLGAAGIPLESELAKQYLALAAS